jgi:tRNA pseudouridine55 synthase
MITKNINELSGFDFDEGVSILFDKPIWWTSFKVVHKIRKATRVKKVGHAGTLDPLATGLLILCTGRLTKEIDSFQALTKTYTGTFTLGKKTLSMDSETEPVEEKPFNHISYDDLLSAKNNFVGEILQTPPMYSAMNFKGKKLYEYARKGKIIERDARPVFIYNFDIIGFNPPEVKFEITCSKGTYIRVIGDDLGRILGCGAYLTALRRTHIGDYSVNDAFEVRDFIALVEKRLQL